MLSAHSHRLVATFYLILLCATGVLSQTIRNPAFWQEQFLRNLTNPDVLASSVNDTSRLASSQDFQTVYAGTDSIMTFRRAIVSFAKSCLSSNLTLERLHTLNYNNSLLSTTITQPKIALVERGGCNWTEKSEVARSLSLAYSLNIEAVIIYDNTSYPAGDLEYTLTATVGTTFIQPYSGELVNERNISHMLDNNIIVGNHSLPLYFVPRLYGRALLNGYAKASSKLTANETAYWMLAPVVRAKEWSSPTSTNNGTTQPGTDTQNPPPDNHEQTLEEFKSSKKYLSYIIGLSVLLFAIIIGAFILLRWWMKRSLANQLAQETQRREEIYRMEQLKKPLPINILNSFPVVRYKVGCVRDTSCSICLDDFEEDVHDIRILPCGHGFCVLCIELPCQDPWLSQKSTLCPTCKQKCYTPEGSGENDDENNNDEPDPDRQPVIPITASDNTLPNDIHRNPTPRTSIDEVIPTISTEATNDQPRPSSLSKTPKEDKPLSHSAGLGVTGSSDENNIPLDDDLPVKESSENRPSSPQSSTHRQVESNTNNSSQQIHDNSVDDPSSHAVPLETIKIDTKDTTK